MNQLKEICCQTCGESSQKAHEEATKHFSGELGETQFLSNYSCPKCGETYELFGWKQGDGIYVDPISQPEDTLPEFDPDLTCPECGDLGEFPIRGMTTSFQYEGKGVSQVEVECNCCECGATFVAEGRVEGEQFHCVSCY